MTSSNFSPRGYKILRLLGTGGTARVFLAQKTGDSRTLALKVPFEEQVDLPKFKALISREYELIGGLKYPGLLRLYGLDDRNSQVPMLLMEHCPGKILNSLGKIKSKENLVNILSSIAVNIYYLSLAGLVHGDLKPHNIFLPCQDENFAADHLLYTKISDFSLGRRLTKSSKTRCGLGTIGYIAPEVSEEKNIDHRSDIFALGIIAYIMATGSHPFMGNETDPVVVSARIKEHRPPSPASLDSTFPENLSDLIMSMMEKNPERRPQSGFAICRKLKASGAQYPYHRAIRPKHVLQILTAVDNREILKNQAFDLAENVIDRLLGYAGNDNTLLRSMLEVNFNKNLLQWRDGRLCFEGDENKIIYPKRLKKYNIRCFHNLRPSQKKKAILTAIAGDIKTAESLGLFDDDELVRLIKLPYIYYLKNNLSGNTITRFSEKLARIALKDYHNEVIASRLYIQAGNIEDGYTVTLDAANKLLNNNQNVEALDLLFSFDNLCAVKNDIDKRLIILMTIGDTQKATGNVSEAEKTYKIIIELYNTRRDDKLLAETYKDLGDLYRIKQNYDEGIGALRRAEELYTHLDDQLGLSHTLNNIGNIYTITSQFDRALRAYRRALKIQRKMNIAHDTASTINNIGALFFFKVKYKRTYRLFNIALKIQRDIGNAGEIARTLNNLGYLCFEMGKPDKALEALRESSEINRKIGSKKELLFNLENLTTITLSTGRLKDSIEYLKEGMSLSKELSDKPHTAIFTMNLAVAQKRMGFYGQALENFKKASQLINEINDNYQYSLCRFELAELYIRLNDIGTAQKITDEISRLANEIDDKKSAFYAGMLNGKIKNDASLIENAITIADKLDVVRYKNSAKLLLAEILLDRQIFDTAYENLLELSDFYTGEDADIDNAKYLYLMASYYAAKGENEYAIESFNKSLRRAGKCSQMPEQIESYAGLGNLYMNSNDPENGYKYYGMALDILKKSADDLKDKQLQQKYLSNSKVTGMAQAIKRLSDILR